MVTGVLRRQGNSFVVEVPGEEVERLHLRDGEAVILDLHASSRPPTATEVPPPDVLDDEDETAYLLRSSRNRERLLRALAQAERGEGASLSLAEVRKELGLAEEA